MLGRDVNGDLITDFVDMGAEAPNDDGSDLRLYGVFNKIPDEETLLHRCFPNVHLVLRRDVPDLEKRRVRVDDVAPMAGLSLIHPAAED